MKIIDHEGNFHCDSLCLHLLKMSWNWIPQNGEYLLWNCLVVYLEIRAGITVSKCFHCHSAAVFFCGKWGVTSIQFTINVNSLSAGYSPTFLVRYSAISYLFFSEAECSRKPFISMLKVSSDSCNLISSYASSLCIWSVVNKSVFSHTSVWP